MKQTTKMSRAVSQLEHIYNSLNTDFFHGELPVPIITVQSKPGTYGHCSVAKVWQRPDGGAYELNIAAEVLNYPIEETLDSMIHELAHLFCRQHGIQEVSRGGTYHNKRFKEEAERRGLECYRTEMYGWNTRPTDRLVEYALEKGWNEIQIGRSTLPPIIRTGAGGTAQPGADTTAASGPAPPASSFAPSAARVCGPPERSTSCAATAWSKWWRYKK